MGPIRARYAGTCARTGQSYPAGALIVKLANGKWALAQDRSGNVKVAPPEPDVRWIHNARTGETKQYDVNKIQFCGCCKERPNFDQNDPATYADCRYERQENGDLHCPACGNIVHLLTDEEVWHQVVLPDLHVCADGTLSHKVGPVMWESVKHCFEYLRYRDLADMADEMDNFDEAENWERMGRGGDWFIRHPHTTEEVEDLLGILPQNRRAVLDVQEREAREKERAKAAEAARVQRERQEAKRRLFDPDQGEYVPRTDDGFDGYVRGHTIRWGEGLNIYGGGEEFVVDADGQHVWHVRNNGMDGDDWSCNNVRTGGAGAIGYRFPLTPERLAFLRQLPDGENLETSGEEGRDG